MNPYYFFKKGLTFLFFTLAFFFSPGFLSACDSSGFIIDGYTDNFDGTFTVTMTILVAGDITTDCGSTYGFYWDIDVPIISVSPPSLTSNNGTTINAVVSGSNITWGDPVPGAGTPFVDATAGTNTPDESFQVTIVLDGQGSEWSGGGQEANTCPQGGCGAITSNYEGVLPCFDPTITAVPAEITICPGIPSMISVIPDHLTETITWPHSGETGESVIVAPTMTTQYEVVATNICGEFTTTVLVNVTPYPTIIAIEDEIEACEGFPVILEVNPANELLVEWDPTGAIGNFLVDVPTSSPTVYVATASNLCGEDSTEILVTLMPGPSVEILNGEEEQICKGDTLTLEAEAMNYDVIQWTPGGGDELEIEVSPDTTTSYVVQAISECGLVADTILVVVNESTKDTLNLEACEGTSVLYNSIPLLAGSTSTFTYTNSVGCDSLETVIVTKLLHSETDLEFGTCMGDSVLYNGELLPPGSMTEFTFIAANGCDSIVTVSVVPLQTYATAEQLQACVGDSAAYNGEMLPAGSVNFFNFTATNGCDSMVTVTVQSLPNFDQTVNLQTCTGTTIPYNGQNLAPGSTTVFDFTTINGCDSVVTVIVEELSVFTTDINLEACTGTNATYNGQSLAPGTVTAFNFITANGCDSVVTVTVDEVIAIEEDVALVACSGSSATYEGQQLLAGTVTEFTYVTPQGCDSIVTVTVDELATYATPLTLEACTGTTVMYNGQSLSPGTTTDITLIALNGCDSVVTVEVEELFDVTGSLMLQACAGETVGYNGQQLAAGTSTDFTYMSAQGCDSVLTVTVEELEVYASPLALQACTGSTVDYNGVPLPPGTTVDFTLAAQNGCDSVVTITVAEIETIYEELEYETCAGTFITYDGQQLPPGTTTDFTFQSVLGCDSIVTVTVDESGILTGAVQLEACAGTTTMYNGQPLAAGSVTDFSFLTPLGCDSIVTVTVDELENFASPLALSACTGTTATYNGQALQPGSVTDFTLTAVNGCDSVVTVTVEELFDVTGSLQLEACTGSSVLFNGQQLAAGSVTDFTLTSAQGCDSVLTVTVMELQHQSSILGLAACVGESVMYNGQSLLAGSVTDVLLVASNGCDSVVTVTVDELQPTASSISLQGCEGETLFYEGIEVDPGSSKEFVFAAANGCDSVVTVTALDPIPSVETFEDMEICEGNSTTIFGQEIFAPGVYSQVFVGDNGCDSTHSVILAYSQDLILGFQSDIEISLGETVVLNPIVNPNATLTFNWSDDPTLSCLDCENPIASPITSTTYFLTISNMDDCTASADVLVQVNLDKGVYIPNSFSPNNDGINDVFMVFSDPTSVSKVLTLKVFSRWGESVFEYYDFPPNDPTYGWDGKHRGKEMDTAVFAYFAEVEFIDGEVRLLKGDVTIVK